MVVLPTTHIPFDCPIWDTVCVLFNVFHMEIGCGKIAKT